jgi:hypothetical protein
MWFLLIQQSAFKILTTQNLFFGSYRKFIIDVSSIWNVLDIMRLGSFWLYVVQNEFGDPGSDFGTNNAAFLITSSWISLLEQLRLSRQVNFILTLLRESLKDMLPFSIVLMILNQAFIFGFLRT